MAWNDSPYALPISTMGTYKPSTDYSSLKGEDPYRYSNTYTPKKVSTGFNKASALNPNGTTRTAVTNSTPVDQYGLAKNMTQSTADNYGESIKSLFGMSNGTGTYGTWTDPLSGKDYKLDEAAYNAVATPYVSPDITATTSSLDFTGANQSGLAGLLSGIGGTKGFADLAGGIGALGSLYTGYKQNKMAEQEHNARMGELARQRQRDADWQRDIKASGLGSYSAGMGGN